MPHPLQKNRKHFDRYQPGKTQANLDGIRFYKQQNGYEDFANTYLVGFQLNINRRHYNVVCSENPYQALKGLESEFNVAQLKGDACRLLTLDKGGKQSRELGQQLNPALTSDGTMVYDTAFDPDNQANQQTRIDLSAATVTMKEAVMYDLLACKFTQNLALLEKLLATGNAMIVEDTASQTNRLDMFWGNGTATKWDGRNALGRLLMTLRDELNHELHEHNAIEVRVGLSPEVCKSLGLRYTPHKVESLDHRATSSSSTTAQQGLFAGTLSSGAAATAVKLAEAALDEANKPSGPR